MPPAILIRSPVMGHSELQIDQQARQAFVLGRDWIRTHDEQAPVGDVTEARPNLLSVHNVMFAIEYGFRAERSQVATGIGLRKTLAPYMITH